MKKTALITGASAGFGVAFVEKFASHGWQCILVARREDRLQKLVKKLNIKSADVHILPLDVRDLEAIKNGIQALPQSFNNIDVLINNAGMALGVDPAWEYDIADWEAMVDTNIKGLLFMTRMILPSMVERNKGHRINVGSIAGSWPYPGGNVYGATKAFTQQFTRNLRADLFGKNVRVSNLEPGMVDTEFSIVRYKGDEEKARKVYENANALQAEDMAEIVFWLTSLPERVNINSIEVMPTSQTWGPLLINRETEK